MGYPSMVKTYAQTKYNVTKCANRRTAKSVKDIVIHYTGTTASAKNNCIYFGDGNRNASADYFIDTDGTIYKFNADCANYYSWHCGDGGGKYGITNARSIGIECVSAGSEFTAEQKSSLKALVTAIMEDYGVSSVVRHYDASRKLCPAPYCGSTAKDAKWAELKACITGTAATTQATATAASTGTEKSGTGFGGTYRCTVNGLRVRTAPSLSGTVVASYNKGQTVVLDDWYKIADGWVWGRYTGASSGKKRYVAVGKPTGGPAADDYLLKVG